MKLPKIRPHKTETLQIRVTPAFKEALAYCADDQPMGVYLIAMAMKGDPHLKKSYQTAKEHKNAH